MMHLSMKRMLSLSSNTQWDFITTILLVLLPTIIFKSSAAEATVPPQNNYTVQNGDTWCIVMTTGIQLTIPYSVQSKNYSANFIIDQNATATGHCGNIKGEETLSIHFFKTWILSFVFSDYQDGSSNNSYFYISRINITYSLDKDRFPKLADGVGGFVDVFTHLDNQTLSADINGSYQCSSNVSLSLNNSIILRFYDLKYRAFGRDNSTWFSDNDVTKCPTEKMFIPESDIKVAVGVGIALGVMMTVTILFYMVVSKATGN